MTEPQQLAVCKCKAHQIDDSPVTRGNNLADKAAKAAAKQQPDLALCILQPVDN